LTNSIQKFSVKFWRKKAKDDGLCPNLLFNINFNEESSVQKLKNKIEQALLFTIRSFKELPCDFTSQLSKKFSQRSQEKPHQTSVHYCQPLRLLNFSFDQEEVNMNELKEGTRENDMELSIKHEPTIKFQRSICRVIFFGALILIFDHGRAKFANGRKLHQRWPEKIHLSIQLCNSKTLQMIQKAQTKRKIAGTKKEFLKRNEEFQFLNLWNKIQGYLFFFWEHSDSTFQSLFWILCSQLMNRLEIRIYSLRIFP